MPPRSRSLRNRKGRFAKPSPRQQQFAGMSLEQFKRRLPPQLRWMCDMDYLDKLSDEERIWLLTVAETEYRGKAAPEDASPMTREQQREAANYVRSQSEDRRPDLMNFAEGYRERRVGLDDMSEAEVDQALRARKNDDVYRLHRPAPPSLAQYKRQMANMRRWRM